MNKQTVVCQSKEILGGTPVFVGTRVPVQTLLDYLEAGERLDDFLGDFPSVTRDQATSFLDQAAELLIAEQSGTST